VVQDLFGGMAVPYRAADGEAACHEIALQLGKVRLSLLHGADLGLTWLARERVARPPEEDDLGFSQLASSTTCG